MTDLGTEFGVEVDKQGHTTSHVFRGLVRVQMVAVDGKAQGTGQVLRENESARVENGDGNAGSWSFRPPSRPTSSARFPS